MMLEGLYNYYKNKECQQCARQLTCVRCTGLVKFSQTKNYGIPERRKEHDKD